MPLLTVSTTYADFVDFDADSSWGGRSADRFDGWDEDLVLGLNRT